MMAVDAISCAMCRELLLDGETHHCPPPLRGTGTPSFSGSPDYLDGIPSRIVPPSPELESLEAPALRVAGSPSVVASSYRNSNNGKENYTSAAPSSNKSRADPTEVREKRFSILRSLVSVSVFHLGTHLR